jgi:hypothetical protein
VTVARIESTGQPAGSIVDDREDRRTLHLELRCVRLGWGKALIGGGKAEKEGLAVNGRPTTDLLQGRTRLRLRRGVRFTVGGRDAKGKGSRSRAANGPGNGLEVGIVGGKIAEGKGSRSRAANRPGNGPEVHFVSGRIAEGKGSRSRAANRPGNGPEVHIVSGKIAEGKGSRSRAANRPGNGPEVHSATDRETPEGAWWKAGQQWRVGSQATTEAEHRGVSEQASRGKPRGGPLDLRIRRNNTRRNEASARLWALSFRRRMRRVIAAPCRWVISAGLNPLAGKVQRRSVSHQSRPRATSRGAGRPKGAVGRAGGTNL